MDFNNGSSHDQIVRDRINEAATKLIRNIPTLSNKQKIFADRVANEEPYGLKSVKAKINHSYIERVLFPILDNEMRKVSRVEASSMQISSLERNAVGHFLLTPLIEQIAYEKGDIVVKFLFGKRKMEWEIMYNGVKIKIGTQWDNILSMRVRLEENSPGILEIVSNKPPLFAKDTNPMPREYRDVSDFHLSYFRDLAALYRHTLMFNQGVLDTHVQKLLRCDARLSQVLHKIPRLDSIEDLTANSGFRATSCDWNQNGP